MTPLYKNPSSTPSLLPFLPFYYYFSNGTDKSVLPTPKDGNKNFRHDNLKEHVGFLTGHLSLCVCMCVCVVFSTINDLVGTGGTGGDNTLKVLQSFDPLLSDPSVLNFSRRCRGLGRLPGTRVVGQRSRVTSRFSFVVKGAVGSLATRRHCAQSSSQRPLGLYLV